MPQVTIRCPFGELNLCDESRLDRNLIVKKLSSSPTPQAEGKGLINFPDNTKADIDVDSVGRDDGAERRTQVLPFKANGTAPDHTLVTVAARFLVPTLTHLWEPRCNPYASSPGP